MKQIPQLKFKTKSGFESVELTAYRWNFVHCGFFSWYLPCNLLSTFFPYLLAFLQPYLRVTYGLKSSWSIKLHSSKRSSSLSPSPRWNCRLSVSCNSYDVQRLLSEVLMFWCYTCVAPVGDNEALGCWFFFSLAKVQHHLFTTQWSMAVSPSRPENYQ